MLRCHKKYDSKVNQKEYLQRALVQDAELQVNIQSDLPLVEKFLQLNMRLFQLLEHRLHVDD